MSGQCSPRRGAGAVEKGRAVEVVVRRVLKRSRMASVLVYSAALAFAAGPPLRPQLPGTPTHARTITMGAPRIDFPPALFGDVGAASASVFAVKTAAIVSSPEFAGWLAPVTSPDLVVGAAITSASRIAVCWLIGAAANDAWSSSALVSPRAAIACTGQAWLTALNARLLLALAQAAIEHSPVNVLTLGTELGALLIGMGAWRLLLALALSRGGFF